jgi:hypothetical protein
MSSLQRNSVTPAVNFPVDQYATSVGTALNITTATLVKGSPGRLVKISVTVAGSTTPGSANDAASVGAASAANQILSIPNAVGEIAVDWPCLAGIVITPGGGGQTLAVSFY